MFLGWRFEQQLIVKELFGVNAEILDQTRYGKTWELNSKYFNLLLINFPESDNSDRLTPIFFVNEIKCRQNSDFLSFVFKDVQIKF